MKIERKYGGFKYWAIDKVLGLVLYFLIDAMAREVEIVKTLEKKEKVRFLLVWATAFCEQRAEEVLEEYLK